MCITALCQQPRQRVGSLPPSHPRSKHAARGSDTTHGSGGPGSGAAAGRLQTLLRAAAAGSAAAASGGALQRRQQQQRTGARPPGGHGGCQGAEGQAGEQRRGEEPAEVSVCPLRLSPLRRRRRITITPLPPPRLHPQMLCSKTLKAKTGQEEQVQELCKGVADFSRQRIADRSSGVLAYEFSQVQAGQWAVGVWGEEGEGLGRRGALALAAAARAAACGMRPTIRHQIVDSRLPAARWLLIYISPTHTLLSLVGQDDYEAGTFHFLELYASQTSMTEHNDHPEIAQFVEKASWRSGGRVTDGQGWRTSSIEERGARILTVPPPCHIPAQPANTPLRTHHPAPAAGPGPAGGQAGHGAVRVPGRYLGARGHGGGVPLLLDGVYQRYQPGGVVCVVGSHSST